ncbi:MAG TPA: sigma-70 family RNA polymerase sigma factor [Polyangia bacterium]|nr:sigma-70 family RNA polymerase sigma factor [Polyangia bacterium]
MVRADGGAESASKADPAQLETLAREALGQTPEAVRRFLLAISPTVGRACRGVMSARHVDLEDTIQESLLDVMRGLPSYRFEGHLVGFVTKVAIRRALLSRRRSVARVRHLQLLDDLHDELPVADASAGELEQAEVMRDLLRRVRPIQAETLVMRVVLGFSVEEIAVATEVSVNTVKTRLRLGKKTLRQLLTWQAAQAPKEPGR